MALNIRSAKADRLARELAAITGESITEAATKALGSRLNQERRRQPGSREQLRQALCDISERSAQIPVLDPRSDDEILGYNDIGTFN